MDFSKLAKSLNPYTIKKGFAYLKQYGFKEFKVRLSERFEKEEVDYGQWCAQHALTEDEKKAQRETKWENPVKISVVVPIYKTDLSVLAALYCRWKRGCIRHKTNYRRILI